MAVTAYPVILVDSATGSDSAASGAGPSTALTGTGASTNTGTGATQIVTLDSGTDLTNVATDGSHVIYLADATAGHRNFAAINAKAGSGGATPTVTVEQAFTISLSGKSWAIGGKRASIAGTASKKLFDNNGTSGDAMPGWVVEMQSGHTETVAAQFDLWRAGDTTSGPVMLRGKSGAATVPIVTGSANGSLFVMRSDYQQLRDFECQNSNGTKTTSIAVVASVGGRFHVLSGLKISHSTNFFWKGIRIDAGEKKLIRNCNIGYCASYGIVTDGSGGGSNRGLTVTGCQIHNCGDHGILNQTDGIGILIIANLIYANGGDGVHVSTSGDYNRVTHLIGNTIDGNTSDGIEVTAADDSIGTMLVVNNILSNNGGYGVKFSSGSATAILLNAYGVMVANNDTYNNTSGAYLPASFGTSDPGLNPTYTSAGAGDYTPTNTSLKGTAYPTTFI